MKKRDIWISVAIIAVAILLLFSFSRAKGQIKINTNGAVTTLWLGNSWLGKTKITSTDKPCEVSARLHRPELLKISMQQGGDTWRLESRGPWGELSRILVKNNDTTVLKLGPPFRIKPRIQRTGSRVSMDFAITGQAGEHYGNVIMLNNKRAPAPKVKIIDEAGSVLASGKFAYG
jgi:hypothetical protein